MLHMHMRHRPPLHPETYLPLRHRPSPSRARGMRAPRHLHHHHHHHHQQQQQQQQHGRGHPPRVCVRVLFLVSWLRAQMRRLPQCLGTRTMHIHSHLRVVLGVGSIRIGRLGYV